jgi:hypothetical protein
VSPSVGHASGRKFAVVGVGSVAPAWCGRRRVLTTVVATVVRSLTAGPLISVGAGLLVALAPGFATPVRACAPVTVALQTVLKDLGASARTARQSPGAIAEDHPLPLLINDLTAISDPVVLVLDDRRLRDYAGSSSREPDWPGRGCRLSRSWPRSPSDRQAMTARSWLPCECGTSTRSALCSTATPQ